MALSNTGLTTDLYGIQRHFGLDNVFDFSTTYATASFLSVDLVSVSSGDLDVKFGLTVQNLTIFPNYESAAIHIVKTASNSHDLDFVRQTTFGPQTVNISTGVTSANIIKNYKIAFYDPSLSGPPGRAEFEWKVLFDDVIVLESLTGATRNYSKMVFASTGTNWCEDFVVFLHHNAASMLGTVPGTIWDNLAISVNGNVACIP